MQIYNKVTHLLFIYTLAGLAQAQSAAMNQAQPCILSENKSAKQKTDRDCQDSRFKTEDCFVHHGCGSLFDSVIVGL